MWCKVRHNSFLSLPKRLSANQDSISSNSNYHSVALIGDWDGLELGGDCIWETRTPQCHRRMNFTHTREMRMIGTRQVTKMHDSDPDAPARFQQEELRRMADAMERRTVFHVTPIDPVYRGGIFKAARSRLGQFMTVLPISLIDKSFVNPEDMIGKPLPVIVEKLPTRDSELVVNHKGALEELRHQLFKSLRPQGLVVEGVVDGIGINYQKGNREFGVFVDLGYRLRGLIHISSLPLDKQPLSAHFRDGTVVRVQVGKKFWRDRSGNPRIELGLIHS